MRTYTYQYSDEVTLEAVYDYDPGQEMVWPDQPPISPSVEVIKVWVEGDKHKADITEILADWVIEAIEQEIFDLAL